MANQGTEVDPENAVSVVDAVSDAVIKTITAGAGAHGVAVGDDGQFAFITNIVDGTLSVIEVATQTVVARFEVGDGPNGATFKPAR